MHIRRLTAADLDACMEITQDRDWDTRREAWATMLQRHEAFGVECDGRLVATVTRTSYPDVTFIGMLLVHSRVARRGVGRALMEHVMHGQESVALVATALGQPLYETLGFRAVDDAVIFHGNIRDAADAQIVTPADLTVERRAAMAAADAAAFGCSRVRMIDQAIDRASAIAFDDSGGFAIAREIGDVRAVGPLAARDAQAAGALVSALSAGRMVRITPLRGDGRFAAILESLGLQPGRSLPLMTHGPWRPSPHWRALFSKGHG